MTDSYGCFSAYYVVLAVYPNDNYSYTFNVTPNK